MDGSRTDPAVIGVYVDVAAAHDADDASAGEAVTVFEDRRDAERRRLAGRPTDTAVQVMPFVLAGTLLALALGPALNALALGEELAAALGARVAATKPLSALAVVLLCGSATPVAGPIAFVGLAVPHAARLLVGPDIRWVLVYCLFLAPALLLGADTVGRVLADQEFQVGVVTAWVGAPLFLILVRYGRVRDL